MNRSKIAGIGYYVPERVVTNDDLTKVMDTTDEWIQERTGIRERRYGKKHEETTTTMAAAAARIACERAGIQPQEIDFIVFATLSPDYYFPGCGVLLQRELGITSQEAGALDIRNQCSGFLYGLATASGLVRSGAAKHVLVVGAETHSAALDFSTRGRSVTSLFGDGAGAVVVSGTDEDKGIRHFKLGADGRYADTLALKVWDIRKRPYIPVNERGNGEVDPVMLWPQMEGKTVFKNAVERMIGGLMECCSEAGITGTDIDFFLFHQANLRINQYVQQTLGIPDEKCIHNIQKFGNTTAATLKIISMEDSTP